MPFWQIVSQIIVLIVLLFLLDNFISQFKTNKKTFYPLITIIIIFTVGFAMRLLGNQEVINLGFYLTEVSYIFIYI